MESVISLKTVSLLYIYKINIIPPDLVLLL